jgi:hypothetical protein
MVGTGRLGTTGHRKIAPEPGPRLPLHIDSNRNSGAHMAEDRVYLFGTPLTYEEVPSRSSAATS